MTTPAKRAWITGSPNAEIEASMSSDTTFRKAFNLYRHATAGTIGTTNMGTFDTAREAWIAANDHGYSQDWFYTVKPRWIEDKAASARLDKAAAASEDRRHVFTDL